MCGSRRELSMSLFLNLLFEQDSYSKEYLVAKIGFITAENEPCKVWDAHMGFSWSRAEPSSSPDSCRSRRTPCSRWASITRRTGALFLHVERPSRSYCECDICSQALLIRAELHRLIDSNSRFSAKFLHRDPFMKLYCKETFPSQGTGEM